MIDFIDNIINTLGADLSEEWCRLIAFCVILFLAYSADFICRKFVLKAISKIVSKTKVTWDDILLNPTVLQKLSKLLIPLVMFIFMPLALVPGTRIFVICQRVLFCYLVILVIGVINKFLEALFTVYSNQERFKNRPLMGLLQTAQVILYIIGAIIIVSIILDKSPAALLTTLGASAAVLMLVFKDSIMGFVSGVQLSANDMLKVGDWISMPKYGADGNVIEVTLNTVKVRNWDNTITTIPPYLLVSDSFQNWRGMSESQGRRIKRSVNIDMTSVKFCTPEMLDEYKKIDLIKDYIQEKETEIEQYNIKHNIDNTILVNGRRQTNLGVFRAYLSNYLNSLPVVNKELTCMVRQLQPTETGIPLELYFFSSIKEWTEYENIQSNVFDHVLAVIPQFGLRVFQSPTGQDLLKGLSGK